MLAAGLIQGSALVGKQYRLLNPVLDHEFVHQRPSGVPLVAVSFYLIVHPSVLFLYCFMQASMPTLEFLGFGHNNFTHQAHCIGIAYVLGAERIPSSTEFATLHVEPTVQTISDGDARLTNFPFFVQLCNQTSQRPHSFRVF